MSVVDETTVAEHLKRPFPARLHYSQEDKCWFVRYPNLPGCLADGDTQEEALRNGEGAKAVWISSALKHGQSIPEPSVDENEYSGRFLVRGTRDLHRRLALMAEQQGGSMNKLAVQLLSDGVARLESGRQVPGVAGVMKWVAEAGQSAVFSQEIQVTTGFGYDAGLGRFIGNQSGVRSRQALELAASPGS